MKPYGKELTTVLLWLLTIRFHSDYTYAFGSVVYIHFAP